ncbi:MAG: hypothetical protein HY744_05400 [Deltaproteobacteria bacterium]|nr:hypothetical protein [Deltaproteobacteria bacterium]
MNETQNNPSNAAAKKALDDIMTIGKAWARHGLTVGKMALETSATTLQKTAELLGHLSQTLTREGEAGAACCQAKTGSEAACPEPPPPPAPPA